VDTPWSGRRLPAGGAGHGPRTGHRGGLGWLDSTRCARPTRAGARGGV